jgi:hypothetical protein
MVGFGKTVGVLNLYYKRNKTSGNLEIIFANGSGLHGFVTLGGYYPLFN